MSDKVPAWAVRAAEKCFWGFNKEQDTGPMIDEFSAIIAAEAPDVRGLVAAAQALVDHPKLLRSFEWRKRLESELAKWREK